MHGLQYGIFESGWFNLLIEIVKAIGEIPKFIMVMVKTSRK